MFNNNVYEVSCLGVFEKCELIVAVEPIFKFFSRVEENV